MSAAADTIDLEELKARYDAILATATPPFAFVDLDAMRRNARLMLDQAGGLPIRVASKSVRSTEVLRRIGELDAGFRGVLAFTVPEALYLAERGFDDIVVGYPSVDRGAIAKVARLAAEAPARAPVLMVDDRPHLDLIEGAIGGGPARAAGLPRHRRRLVADGRARGADRPEALARARARPRAAHGRGDRRSARHPARGADGL